MKTFYYYITAFLLSIAMIACDEEKVQAFSSDRGINFVVASGNSSFTDSYTQLSSDINFYTLYVTKGIELNETSIPLGVQLEGTISTQPINIRLKTLEKEGYEPAEIIVPGDSAIEAGKYARSITVTCKKPQSFDKEYGAIVTFDYEHSDVVPGTKERQCFDVTVTDATIWTDMEVNNEEEWNTNFASTLGQYGDVKVRFILATMGKLEYSYESIMNLYYYTRYYPSYGFNQFMSTLNTALQEYNDTHDQPLCEQDGTPVTFN